MPPGSRSCTTCAERAAARRLLEQTGSASSDPWIPVGVGVHTGVSYVGSVGEGDARDFTAVGDTVNTAARLTDRAGAGEILISADAAMAAGLETTCSNAARWNSAAVPLDAWVAGATP